MNKCADAIHAAMQSSIETFVMNSRKWSEVATHDTRLMVGTCRRCGWVLSVVIGREPKASEEPELTLGMEVIR